MLAIRCFACRVLCVDQVVCTPGRPSGAWNVCFSPKVQNFLQLATTSLGIHCPVCRPSASTALVGMSGSLLEHAANGGASFPGLGAARTSKGMALPGQKPGQAAHIKLEGELPHKQPVRGSCCTHRQSHCPVPVCSSVCRAVPVVPAGTAPWEAQLVVRVCPTFGSREWGWQEARGLHLDWTAAALLLLCMCCSNQVCEGNQFEQCSKLTHSAKGSCNRMPNVQLVAAGLVWRR